nr:caffeoylshikimate esterase-like [Tanacetum cinerariifolium]
MQQEQPPPFFWGDTPEDEYYASQGVRNSKSYFQTPNAKIFTQSWHPLDQPIKGVVFMTHGYRSDCSWSFQEICIAYAKWGYAVYAADLIGHGRSDGLHGYIGDMDKAAATSLSYYVSVRKSKEYGNLPAFMFGQSMGGMVTMLMYLQSGPGTWTGLIFAAPLFVLPEAATPSKLHLTMYGLLFGLADKWAVMPDPRVGARAIRDVEKQKILDGLASHSGSEMLYEKAATAKEDKELKLYEGMYHSLINGEPDEDANRVLGDMRAWIDDKAKKFGTKALDNAIW